MAIAIIIAITPTAMYVIKSVVVARFVCEAVGVGVACTADAWNEVSAEDPQ